MKKTLLPLTFLSLVSVCLCQQQHPAYSSKYEAIDVARNGKNVNLLIEVMANGASTPKTLYAKTKDPKDEPKKADYLTPLGTRQQLLIGAEMRSRYVDEARMLNYSYDIQDIWIQTTFDQKTILSAQAQMHGLYPPSTNINFLTEWQQANAVPPLDNVLSDQWTTWQKELGNSALTDGLNVYPINVEGHEDDFLMMLNANICPMLGTAITSSLAAFQVTIKDLTDVLYPSLKVYLGSTPDLATAMSFCDYLQWADLNSIELTVAYKASDLTQCQSLLESYIQNTITVDQSLGYITSQTFLTQTRDKLKAATGLMDYKKTHFYLKNAAKSTDRGDDAFKNNADAKPSFFLYVTEEINVRLLLSGLVGKKTSLQGLLGAGSQPSSNLIFEMYQDAGKFFVDAFYNDEQVQLGGCSSLTCDTTTFLTYLDHAITMTDVPAACKAAQEFIN